MRVVVEKRFLRKFKKMDKEDKLRILKILKRLESEDLDKLDIKKLKGYNYIYRIRVGDFRILFKKEKDTIKIFDIEKRGRAYRRL